MKKKSVLLIAMAALLMLGSCTVVKQYEKVNLNDPDMALADRKVDKFHTKFQSYREAASGANGGTTGGGCGCN